jgi:hypothetical protein
MATPRTLPIPDGYVLLPDNPDILIEAGDLFYDSGLKKFVPSTMKGKLPVGGFCYIRPKKVRTACCDYAAEINNYPVYYNRFNNVVQCHNCGKIYVPSQVKF